MVYPVNGQSGTSTADVQNAKVATSTASHEPDLQEGKKLITIQRGETLTGIARKYQTTLDQLIKLNGIKNPDKVKAGEMIWVNTAAAESNKTAVVSQKTAETETDIKAKKDSESATVAEISQGSTKNNLYYINHVISALAMVQLASVFTAAQSAPVDMFEFFVNNDSAQENYTIVLEPTPAKPIQVEETKTGAFAQTAAALATVQKTEAARSDATKLSRGENTFSKEDIELLARVIYAEARGEDFEGQVAVGAVVLNRLADSRFPKTVRDVIYQQGAFTAVSDKQINLKPDDEAYRAAEAAIAGEDPTDGAIYYYNPRTATDRWIKSRKVIKTIGNHTFSI